MLTRFICPDGAEIEIRECIAKCRLGARCLTKQTLFKLSEVRPWKGIPSVTQLLKGTYQAFLEITEDYAEDPNSMAFKLLGITVHAGLDTSVSGTLSEDDMGRLISKDGISGLPDLYEEEDGKRILTDYKTSGSYKITKALGIAYTLQDSQTEVYKQKTVVTDPITKEKITRLKGEPKLLKVWKEDLSKQDCKDWVLQLNYYRLMMEEAGFPIDMLRVQSIIRDGGLQVATTRGLDKLMYLIPIPILSNDEINDYFIPKKNDLLAALVANNWSTQCTDEETWEGRKCGNYCPVSKQCRYV